MTHDRPSTSHQERRCLASRFVADDSFGEFSRFYRASEVPGSLDEIRECHVDVASRFVADERFGVFSRMNRAGEVPGFVDKSREVHVALGRC